MYLQLFAAFKCVYFLCIYVCMCMCLCTLYLIILKGTGEMTAKDAAVSVMIKDHFLHVPEPGHGSLYLCTYMMKKYCNNHLKIWFNLGAKLLQNV